METNYESRVRAYEAEGMTTSDAQAVCDAEDLKAEPKVLIIDCEKAGLIGGPFAVHVVRGGKVTAMRGGLRSLERAQQVACQLRGQMVMEVVGRYGQELAL